MRGGEHFRSQPSPDLRARRGPGAAGRKSPLEVGIFGEARAAVPAALFGRQQRRDACELEVFGRLSWSWSADLAPGLLLAWTTPAYAR